MRSTFFFAALLLAVALAGAVKKCAPSQTVVEP